MSVSGEPGALLWPTMISFLKPVGVSASARSMRNSHITGTLGGAAEEAFGAVIAPRLRPRALLIRLKVENAGRRLRYSQVSRRDRD